MADIAPSQRIVPGAPPPPLLSKSQKKKRKSVIKPKGTDAPSPESDSKGNSVAEKIPEEPDVKKDAVAEVVETTQLEPTQEAIQDKSKKASPAVELLNKRIKVQNKKLVSNLMLLLVCGGQSMRPLATMRGFPCALPETCSCFSSLCEVAYTLHKHVLQCSSLYG